ncbi:helix-turn-helix domain-containing protein [Aquimarina algicola]|uniref:Helix-turn-helix transcriptional regulator n=1 Tax=Aquimarina algicola TaxID=2589995 RepID=A0A504J947_9FLAO|nr:helix-turn-helix transcriptional regulator [Aquimarina algicola]TPN87436.1 helix-turn-helix transcriptional regulator [Aquimarina algicola]
MFKQIGENIKILRGKRNISQTDLGEKLNVSRQQVANYEKGDTTIPLNSVMQIADIFGLSIDTLVKSRLAELSDSKLTDLLNNNLEHQNHLGHLGINKENSSIGKLHDYLDSIVKEKLEPVEDLLRKVLLKIELTDLKYDLSEEIKKANTFIEEKQRDS